MARKHAGLERLSHKINFEDAKEAIRELLRLSTEPKWSRIAKEAYGQMRVLRACGFTNEQISRITGQRWKTGVVKNATAKTSVSSPDIAQRTISILVQVAKTNLSTPDLEKAVYIAKEVEGSKVHLSEIVAFLEKLKENKVGLDQFFKDYSQMNEQKLTPHDLRTAITYKDGLEAAGFNLAALNQLKSLADKYGKPQTVLTALESYGNLTAINKDLESKKSEFEDAKKLLITIDAQLKRHQDLEQLSKALTENYHQLQQALNNGTKDISKDLADKLQTITEKFNTETNQKLTQLSTTYANEIENRLKQIDTTINNLRAPFENSAKKLLDSIENDIKSADTLAKTYSTLQQSLQSSIEELPDHLKVELTKIADEFRNETKSILSQTTKDFTTEATKNLENIKQGLSDLNKQLEKNNETFSKSVADAVNKTTTAITNLASLASDTVSKDQNRYRQSLETIQQEAINRFTNVKDALDKLRSGFEERREAMVDATNKCISDATLNIEALSKRAVEAGEKFKEIELRHAQSRPYLELLQMVKDPASTSPHVLATMITILTAFDRWLVSKPQTIVYHLRLRSACDQFLKQLKEERPDI